MSAALLALLICVFAGLCFRMPERVILSTYPLLDFLTRLRTRVRVLFLLDSKSAGYLLLTGHGKGTWDEVDGACKHILIDPVDFAENVFHPSSDA